MKISTKTNLDHIDHTDDVRMIDPPQDENLWHETLLKLLVKSFHSDLFDSNFGAVNEVLRFENNGERTRPDLPTNQVVSNNPTRGLSHFFYPINRRRESRGLNEKVGALKLSWERNLFGIYDPSGWKWIRLGVFG